MHTLFLFLAVCSIGAAAQNVFPVYFDPDLRVFLRLSEEQERDLFGNFVRYQAAVEGAGKRLAALNRELDEEVRKAAPDAGNLGVRYREIELLCRGVESPRRDSNELQMRVLTEEQRGRLRPLADFDRVWPLAVAAEGIYLLPAREGSRRWASILVLGVDISAEVAVELGLTIAQLEQIRSVLRDFEGFVRAREARAAEVRRELELEFGAESPAAVELGLRYVELVAQERQMKERESEVERALAGILTAEQKRRLGEWAPILQSGQVVYAARGLNLLPAVGPKTPASEGLGGLPFYLPTAFLPGAGAFLPEVMRYCKAGLAITPE